MSTSTSGSNTYGGQYSHTGLYQMIIENFADPNWTQIDIPGVCSLTCYLRKFVDEHINKAHLTLIDRICQIILRVSEHEQEIHELCRTRDQNEGPPMPIHPENPKFIHQGYAKAIGCFTCTQYIYSDEYKLLDEYTIKICHDLLNYITETIDTLRGMEHTVEMASLRRKCREKREAAVAAWNANYKAHNVSTERFETLERSRY